MVSERVKVALQEDLAEAVRQVEALGLWVHVGGSRIAGEDLVVVVVPGSTPAAIPAARMGRPKKNVTASGVLVKTVTRMEHPGELSPACEVCGEVLKTGRGSGNRKVPLCGKHAGRWFVYRKRNGEGSYAAWVANQKAGGGRLKKA
jgi:hypothetical protein